MTLKDRVTRLEIAIKEFNGRYDYYGANSNAGIRSKVLKAYDLIDEIAANHGVSKKALLKITCIKERGRILNLEHE